MKLQRRKFLQQAALMGVAPLFLSTFSSCKNQKSTIQQALDQGFTIDQFGIQLFTVRDFMAKEPLETIKLLGKYGYKQIESFQGEKGVFWGLTPQEYKSFLMDNALTCVSTHCDNSYAMDIRKEDEFRKLADEAVSVGIQYLIIPWMGNLKTIDEFKQTAQDFNRLGSIAKSAGLHFAYHNHSYSFRPIDGQFPQKILMDETDAELVDYEMDIYWVVNAGQDPVKWLQDYPGRFTLCHIKDKYSDEKIISLNGTPDSDENYSCILGTGVIDFETILTEANNQGMKHWIVEQERYDGITSMDAAEADAEFMELYLG